jgi:hypothetical protein
LEDCVAITGQERTDETERERRNVSQVHKWVARIPRVSWFVLFVAIVAGIYSHAENPHGILLYTPRDWCSANRLHAFAFGFLAVLVLCGAMTGLIAIGGWMARGVAESGEFKKRLVRAFLPSISSLLMFLSVAPVGIAVGELLPIKIDALCQQGH